MSHKDTKKWIRNYYRLHGNTKLIIDNQKMTFLLMMGDCLSMEIEYPLCLKREIKLNKLFL
jgi:hypothetical protein